MIYFNIYIRWKQIYKCRNTMHHWFHHRPLLPQCWILGDTIPIELSKRCQWGFHGMCIISSEREVPQLLPIILLIYLNYIIYIFLRVICLSPSYTKHLDRYLFVLIFFTQTILLLLLNNCEETISSTPTDFTSPRKLIAAYGICVGIDTIAKRL